MKTYKVSFQLNGKIMRTTITAMDKQGATELIKAQYPGAISIDLTEMR